MSTEAAERAVVGSALRNPTVAVEMAARLPLGAFADVLCSAAWAAITTAVENGEPTDVVSVSARIAAGGKGELANPAVALFGIVEAAIDGQADWHASLIEDAYARRRAREAGERFLQHLETTQDLMSLLEHHRDQIDDIPGRQSTVKTAEELFTTVLDKAEDSGGEVVVASGWSDVDRMVHLRAGQLVVVAARPSVGKSTVLTDVARHVASKGQTVVLVSLEMTGDEVGAKLLAAHAKVDVTAVATGTMGDDDWERAAKALPELTALPLIVDDNPRASIADIRALARRHKPALIAVDYLQLVKAPKTDSRQEAVAAVSRGLKVLAKETGSVVMAAAQLNRAADQRHNKTPVLSDLRESGSIEADADIVLLLHREDLYERESPRAGEIDVIVAKQRGGSTGTVTLGFDGVHSRLVQLALEFKYRGTS